MSSLTGPLPPAAAMAVANLDETSREVQQKGWHFNTEYAVELSRNTEGKIPLPLNVARADIRDIDVVQRGSFFFNLEEIGRAHV